MDSLTDHSCSTESDGEKAPCRAGEPLCESGSECKDKYEEIEEDEDEEDVEEEDEEEEEAGRGLPAKPITSSPLTGVEAPLLGHPPPGENAARNVGKAILDGRLPIAAPPPAPPSKPKLWSLAEIATSDLKHPQPPPGLGPCGPPAAPPATAPPAAAYPASSLLGRHLYYTAPFYSNYTNYGNFGALQGQSLLRYNSAAVASGDGLGQAVLSGSGSVAQKQGADNSLKSLANHLEQHYKPSGADAKKGRQEEDGERVGGRGRACWGGRFRRERLAGCQPCPRSARTAAAWQDAPRGILQPLAWNLLFVCFLSVSETAEDCAPGCGAGCLRSVAQLLRLQGHFRQEEDLAVTVVLL